MIQSSQKERNFSAVTITLPELLLNKDIGVSLWSDGGDKSVS